MATLLYFFAVVTYAIWPYLALLALPACVIATWLRLFFYSHRLLYTFRDRYPDEARRKIVGALEFTRSPSKFLYFLSKDSKKFLEEKEDQELLAKRKIHMRLTWAALIVPSGGMILLVVILSLWAPA